MTPWALLESFQGRSMAPADCVGMREVPGTRAAFLKPSILNLSRLHTCKRKAPELSISAPAFASSATAIMTWAARSKRGQCWPYRVRLFFTGNKKRIRLFFTGKKKKESETEPRARSFCFALRSLRPCLVSKNFQDFPSHQIFEYMHGILNVV